MTSYCLSDRPYRDRPFAFFWDAVGVCSQNLHPSFTMHDWTFSFMALMHANVWWEVDA